MLLCIRKKSKKSAICQ